MQNRKSPFSFSFSGFLPKLVIFLALAGALFILFSVSNGSKTSDKTKREEELAAFLESGKGVGKAKVTLCFASDGETVTGAAVVCMGGNDPLVRAEVTQLLCAALDVRANRIYVSASG